ncbi:MAG TPA: hypothetical protein P5110_05280 [Candidatus Omnitrophota bacterium]|nr:hypothetical protein [Candidatus Omnitrophota bacterium]
MRRRIGVGLVTICVAVSVLLGATYDRNEEAVPRAPREFSGKIVAFGDTFVSVQRETSRTAAVRHRFKIIKETIITGTLSVGAQVRVLYKVVRFSRKKSVRRALLIEVIPEVKPQDAEAEALPPSAIEENDEEY